MKRRTLLAALPALAVEPASDPLIERIETKMIWEGKKSRQCWFHPKVARVPGAKPRLLMTVQLLTDSDVMHQPHYSESFDEGQTWTERKPIPALERRVLGGGLEDVVSDIVPEYHAPSKTVLCLGQDVHYKDEKLYRPRNDRWIRYFAYKPDGTWTQPRKLEFTHPDATEMMTAGCGQRITLPGGDVLVPVTLSADRADSAVTSVRCTFDGTTMQVKQHGRVLKYAVRRGLMEPSLAWHGGSYWMTIRAEDDRAYFSKSSGGLTWEDMERHRFDDGSPLVTSTTQQHWIRHSQALYLTYTRKDAVNEKIFRWRTPTYMARFDTARGVLVKASERILVPMDGEAMHGNFHVTPISPTKTLVTLGDLLVDKPFRGDTLVTTIHWKVPNRA